MKVDLNILNKYIEEGWVIKNEHPTLPLSIYNYSPSTQYENKWDEITRMCRGLVLDNEGNVVAKPFSKFHNLDEHQPEDIPNETFEVFEKMDGSLGILFNFQGEWILATKGSFTSEQAIRAKEMLKKYRYERLLTGFTYLFEIIYPENRIVVDYEGLEDLVLLAVIDNADGYELKIHDDDIHLEGIRFRNLYKNLGFNLVKKYNGITDYSILSGMISTDREGFVVRFKNGFRVKIKGEEYKRLHKIVTNVSNRTIWEYLAEGKPFDEILEKVPDEFYNWVKETVKDLQTRFDNIERDYLMIFNEMIKKYPERKDFALIAKGYPHYALLFSMLDNRDYKKIIWKNLYPKYSKPFKKD